MADELKTKLRWVTLLAGLGLITTGALLRDLSGFMFGVYVLNDVGPILLGWKRVVYEQ